MSRSLRTAFTIATIALALAACDTGSDEAAEAVTEAPATEAPATDVSVVAEGAASDSASEAPVTTEAPAADTGSASSADTTPSAPSTTIASDPTPASAPNTDPVRCTDEQGPAGPTYRVTGIAADDADGGLVVRPAAGTSFEARGVLADQTVVDTYYDDAEWPSCLVDSLGNVWWEIGHPSFATGGWVNSFYLEPFVDESGEEADAHAECVYPVENDDSCVLFYRAAGEITFVEPYSEEMGTELEAACADRNIVGACEVLAFVESEAELD